VITIIVISIAAGLLANEVTSVSPWIAGKIARWSAGSQYADNPARAVIRAEELAALINKRPGNLFKLLTASGFACAAIAAAGRRALGERPAVTIIKALGTCILALVVALAYVIRAIFYAYVFVMVMLPTSAMIGCIAGVPVGMVFGAGVGALVGTVVGVAYFVSVCIGWYRDWRENRLPGDRGAETEEVT